MNPSDLWLNEYDPNLDAIGNYADPLHNDCDGMGIVRECGGWAFCSCTNAALAAADEDEPELASIARLLTPQPGFRQATGFFTREQKPLKLAA